MTKREMKRRLDKLASDAIDLNIDVIEKYGENAAIYLRHDGTLCVMKPDDDGATYRPVIESGWCGIQKG
jgi:hypothetical protein